MKLFLEPDRVAEVAGGDYTSSAAATMRNDDEADVSEMKFLPGEEEGDSTQQGSSITAASLDMVLKPSPFLSGPCGVTPLFWPLPQMCSSRHARG